MTAPVRLRLSRKKGFDLQALSLATNGLQAVVVTRATIWGNTFSTEPAKCLSTSGKRYPTTIVPTVEEAIARFRVGLHPDSKRMARISELRGKNLACACRLGAPCHADVWLDLANRPVCEEA